MSRTTHSMLLWIAAFLIATALGYFQRTTGPTYPLRGTVMVAGGELSYKLPRTHGGDGGLVIRLSATGVAGGGTVEWRRFPSDEPWREIAMVDDGGGWLTAVIPHQPPAGKVEYRLVVNPGEHERVIPREGDWVVARFRGDVPATILIPHILAMFGSMMLATRALLAVARSGAVVPTGLVVASMVLLILGGLFLGPVVQKFAFGAYWTGWPFGHDLTDNKTAIAVLAWLPATILALQRSRRSRAAVVLGWLVIMGVFLIPHSLRGSQLDWSEQTGVSSSSALDSEG